MKQTIDIHKWVIEATSNHNDGWVRQHYINKLKKLKGELNSLEFLNEYNLLLLKFLLLISLNLLINIPENFNGDVLMNLFDDTNGI